MTQPPRSFWGWGSGRVPAKIAAEQGHSIVLDAQVLVETAHRSAQADNQRYAVARHDDFGEPRALCVANGLMKISLRMYG